MGGCGDLVDWGRLATLRCRSQPIRTSAPSAAVARCSGGAAGEGEGQLPDPPTRSALRSEAGANEPGEEAARSGAVSRRVCPASHPVRKLVRNYVGHYRLREHPHFWLPSALADFITA